MQEMLKTCLPLGFFGKQQDVEKWEGTLIIIWFNSLYVTDEETESGFINPKFGSWAPNLIFLVVKQKEC